MTPATEILARPVLFADCETHLRLRDAASRNNAFCTPLCSHKLRGIRMFGLGGNAVPVCKRPFRRPDRGSETDAGFAEEGSRLGAAGHLLV